MILFDPAMGYDDIRIDGEKRAVHTKYEKKIYDFDITTVIVWYPYYEIEIDFESLARAFELTYWNYTPDDTIRYAILDDKRQK